MYLHVLTNTINHTFFFLDFTLRFNTSSIVSTTFFFSRIYQLSLSLFFFKQTERKKEKEKEKSISINHPRPRVIFLLLLPFDRLLRKRATFTICDSNPNFPIFPYTHAYLFQGYRDNVNEIPGGIFRQSVGLGAGELVGADDHQIDQHAGQPPGDRQSSRREQ